MSRSVSMIGGLTLTGKFEANYAISIVRSATLRVRVNLNVAETGSKMPTPYSNLSLLAVLDVNGVVHFYTVTELEELKPLGGGMRARLSVKGTGTVPSKSEEKILTECMSFSLEHEHVKSYDNVHRANIPIVDMRMDTSEYNRIILVSVDELGGVHTTVIGYQIFRGGLFVGQILPVDASAVVKPGSVKKSSKSVNNVATAEKQIHSPVTAEKTALVEVDANGEVKVSENANIPEEDKASVVAEDSKVEAVVSASESVHRSEASILTSEFDKNAEKYGTSPSKVNIVWGGVVSQKSKVPLDMLNLQLSADVSTHMQPMSLLVLPNSLNNTRMTLADANRTSHIYAVGLSTGTEAVPGRSYPIVAFLQPDGAMLHSYSAAAPAAASITLTSTHMGNGAGSNTGAPFGVVDLAVVPSDSMVVAITRDSIHLISTKAFTADARERRSANFVNTAGSKNTWVFGMHECLSHDAGDADDNAEFYMMRQGGFEELVSVRLFNSRVVLLSVRMTSGVVNLYHIKYDLVAAPAVSDTSTGAATESKVKLEDSGQGQGESIPEPVMLRQYSAHYVGSIDPPYLPVTTTSTTTSSTSVSSATTFPSAGSASRMALFNFEAGKRSQLLLSSAQSCSVGLFNISSPIKVDAADDIVFFRRKFAPNCYRVEVHGSRSEALGAQLLSGVEIFTSTSVSSSTMTSGSIGGVSQAHLVPRKGPTTAALSQRRKPPSGFGPGGGPMTAGAKISAQSVISNYNNLIVAYNHYNATCADSDVPCEAIITGRVLFYEQLSNVDAQATEQMAGLMKYGMYGVIILAAIIIRFLLKGFGNSRDRKGSGRSFRPGKYGSKKGTGKGRFASTQANDDSGDDGSLAGRYNRMKRESGHVGDDDGDGIDSEMKQLIGRASHLQKLIDDAEQEVYRKKSREKRGILGGNSTYPTGVGNSAYTNKLRSELYDEPHKYQLSD